MHNVPRLCVTSELTSSRTYCRTKDIAGWPDSCALQRRWQYYHRKGSLDADMGLVTACGRIKIAESKLRWLAREDAYFNKFKLSCAEVQ
jgi:hypothetical protein